MNRLKALFASFLLLLLAFFLYRSFGVQTRVSAFSTGPPAAVTGAPGEATCHDCHDSYDLNDPSGGVTIVGLPDFYVPSGDPVSFCVMVFQDGSNGANIDWGFEITVLDANNLFAGTLTVTDTTNTQPDANVDGTRFYIKQTSDGTFFNPGGAPGATWTMSWTPPDTDVGPVTFYVAANAGNGNHFPSGDYIFTNTQTVSGPETSAFPSTVPLLLWPNAAAVLRFRRPSAAHVRSPYGSLASRKRLSSLRSRKPSAAL